MTTEERKREIFAQPSAAKEVYVPEDHHVNGHIIVRGPDSHTQSEPYHLSPGSPYLKPSSSTTDNPWDHANTGQDRITVYRGKLLITQYIANSGKFMFAVGEDIPDENWRYGPGTYTVGFPEERYGSRGQLLSVMGGIGCPKLQQQFNPTNLIPGSLLIAWYVDDGHWPY